MKGILMTSAVVLHFLFDTGYPAAKPTGNGERAFTPRTIETPCMALSTRPLQPGFATIMTCSKSQLPTEDSDEHARLSVDPLIETTGHTFLFYRDTATPQDIQDTIEPNLRRTELSIERLTREILSAVKSDRGGIAALVIHPTGAAAVYAVHEILRDDERSLQFRGRLSTRVPAGFPNKGSLEGHE